MNLTGGIVLFATIWFMAFLTILPIGHKSQSDAGHVVPGTPASAPAELNMKRKVAITTIITVIVWGICAAVLLSGAITLDDVTWFGPTRPAPVAATGTAG